VSAPNYNARGGPGGPFWPNGQAGQGRPATARGGCAGALLAGLAGAALALLLLGTLLFGYASIAAALPDPAELQARASQFASTLIYDRQGELLYEIADPQHGRRTRVPLDQISPHLRDATVATEDPNFYQHPGVDPIGIARAIYYAIRERDLSSSPGGSTITQQLVKLTFLSSERTLSRKIKEAILAAEITRRYPKDTVLEIYLNEIYYGNLAYGVEAAAETCFGKQAADLSLAEATLLAGLPQAPAYYDPYTKLWNADSTPGPVKQRQGTVLRLMVEHGYLSPAQADAAWQEPLRLKPLAQTAGAKAPHFVQYARHQVEQVVGPQLMAKGGLRIYTTLDPRLQAIAEEEVAKQVTALAKQAATNGALVALRPATGEILAMVGSADFSNEQISGQINMAIAPRQPGSAIKPLTYLAAFELPAPTIEPDTRPSDQTSKVTAFGAIEPPGYWTPATALMDIHTEFPDGANPPYVPTNYDDQEHGLVSVRSALANSYNVPAVKALEHVGLDRLKEMAARLGITTLTRPDFGLSLTLGGGEVTLLELTGAYAVLADGGVRAPLTPIACVLDSDGRPIWQSNGAESVAACQAATRRGDAALLVRPFPPQPAVSPQHAYLMTSILSDLEARRPMFGRNAELLSLVLSPAEGLPDRPAAAKTGTTNDYRDAWTLGYTPELAVGVWVGNADYKPMQKLAGAVGAAPIWHNVMQRGLERTPPQPFPVPVGLQRVRVCADSGTLPSEACPNQREEWFAEGQGPLPAQFDLHQRVKIDKVTGQLATDFTPADRVEVRDVMIFPPRYRAWAEAHGIPQLALERPGYPFPPELELREPADGSRVTGTISIVGRVHLPEPLIWRVEYGVGPAPIGWGVVAGPARGDPSTSSPLPSVGDFAGQVVDGVLAAWDTALPLEKHGVNDYSLRLAAYDPANLDYPVAVSSAAYVWVEAPTPTPTLSPTATPTAVEVTPTPTETPTPTATPTETAAIPTALPTDTPQATETAAPELPTDTPVPTETAAPVETAVPTETPEPIAALLQAVITEPPEGTQLSGTVAVKGTAGGSAFHAYQLEYAALPPGIDQQSDSLRPAPDAWQPVEARLFAPMIEGILGWWHIELIPAGRYVLRLTVFDSEGNLTMAQVVVEVAAAQ
jgi:penicillin-binding protein 1C